MVTTRLHSRAHRDHKGVRAAELNVSRGGSGAVCGPRNAEERSGTRARRCGNAVVGHCPSSWVG